LDDIQLDSALYELNKYRAYEKAVEQKKEERNDESQRVESQESEEEREYSEESSRTESSIRKMTTTGGRKRTRNVEDD
jgi:biopolymer transport protein ExbB/TolQ